MVSRVDSEVRGCDNEHDGDNGADQCKRVLVKAIVVMVV